MQKTLKETFAAKVDPLNMFSKWFAQAKNKVPYDPTIMTLATATKTGKPSARIVLLKKFDEDGFVFYTNLRSHKGKELKNNPYAALCFFWPELDKQVRIEGKVKMISDIEADEYFATRPRQSQIGAWASNQSRRLESLGALYRNVKRYHEKFRNSPVPRPKYWVGFRLKPKLIEFWERGEHRLHERTCFRLKRGEWQMEFLYP